MRHVRNLPSHIAGAEGHEPGDERNQGDRAQYPTPPRHTILRFLERDPEKWKPVFRQIARPK